MNQLQPQESEITTSPSDEEKECQEQERKEQERQRQIELVKGAFKDVFLYNRKGDDLSDPEIYHLHSLLVAKCANSVLSKRGRTFIVDDCNRDIMRFLLYYFNGSDKALTVFPNAHYSLDKNIMLVGEVGVGKTFIMDVFAMYLKVTHNPKAYKVSSQTQMLNYYRQHNNIDYYTYNTLDGNTFDGKPFSICLNDIGLRTTKFYGEDMSSVLEEFLYSRHEIWDQQGVMTHLTTNLDKSDIDTLFADEHKRLADRLKMFNVIPVGGTSRR